jgi:hypothetical protein
MNPSVQAILHLISPITSRVAGKLLGHEETKLLKDLQNVNVSLTHNQCRKISGRCQQNVVPQTQNVARSTKMEKW